MTSNSSVNYKVIWALSLVLLTMRIAFGSFFTSASDITPVNVAQAINNERAQRNIPTLNYNSKLAAAAQYKANDMVVRKYFSHVDPDGHYIWDKIAEEGYTPFTILGENLAVDFSDTEGLISAWMDSPTHRENILNPSFADQGVGVDFGNTANAEFSAAIANTFGAQPAQAHTVPPPPAPASAPKTTPPPAPTPKPAPQQVQPQPAPTPEPLPAPKPVPANTPSIALTNTIGLVYSNLLSINGQTVPNIAVQIQDLTNPQAPQASLQSDQNGQFSYTFTDLANGQHRFQAKAQVGNQSLLSNIYTVQISYNPPAIDQANTAVSASIQNAKLVLNVTTRITGEVALATASVNGQSTNLTEGPIGTFSGVITLDQYFDYQSQEMTLTAQNSHHNNVTARLSMAGVPLNSPNPKSFAGNLPQKAAHADLYNAFKYVVVVFGGLFILFLLIDLFKYEKKKITGAFTGGNASLIILLLISTMLFANWWH